MRAKRTTRRKKLSTGQKVAIGAMVVGGGFLAWKYLIQPMINKEPEPEPVTGGGSVDQATTNVVTQVQQLPVNVKPKLTAIGTPGNQQDWGVMLKYGDKGGEIETLQKLINRIYKAKRSVKSIKVDGVYGNETLKARNELFNKDRGVNLTLAFNTFKQLEKSAGVSTGSISFPTYSPLDPLNLIPGL